MSEEQFHRKNIVVPEMPDLLWKAFRIQCMDAEITVDDAIVEAVQDWVLKKRNGGGKSGDAEVTHGNERQRAQGEVGVAA